MTNNVLFRLGVVMMILSLLIPVLIFFIFWLSFGLKVGAIAYFASLVFFLMLGSICLSLVQSNVWKQKAIWFPFIFGSLYSILPDIIPGNIDDTTIFAAGALLTLGLSLKHNPSITKSIAFPVIIASVYTLIGVFIPGPVDELIVYLITGIWGYKKSGHELNKKDELESISNSSVED